MVIRLSVGAALIVLGSQTVAAQNDVSVDGYSVEGLRGYRDAAIEIENSYRFDDRHRDEIDAVSGGWNSPHC